MGNLKQLAFEQKKYMLFLIAAAAVKGLSTIGQALFFVLIADGVFLKGDTFQDIIPMLIGLFAAIIIRAASSFAIGRTGVNLAAKVKQTLRTKLVKSFADDPIQASMQGQSGQKVSLLLDAVDEVDGFFSKYIPQMIQSYIIPLMLIIVIFLQNWTTGLIILITAPFIPVFMAIVGKRTKIKADEQMEQLSRFSGTFLDILQGLTTLKLFGQADKQKQKIKKSSLDFRDSTMEVLKSAFLSSLMLEYISMLSIGIIALEIGLRLVVFDNITFFTAFLVMILVPDFFTMLKDFGSAFHSARGSVAASNLLENELAKERQTVVWGEQQLPYGPPHISLDDAAFQYGDGFALQAVRAEIQPYSHIAVIGKSGSGKTTLLHLIAGLLPESSGKVTFNGMPRENISESSWFGQLSYISQNPYLFAGTIAENISVGTKRTTSREEIQEAAEKAGISDMISSLENGFETAIGEAGRGLSGGEKQRIALARAFLKKPSIILFDEPTIGLDLKTEQILQKSLAELGKKATVITVAHRLHTIKESDSILFLSDGKLVAAGHYEELAEQYEPFRNMLDLQQGGVLR